MKFAICYAVVGAVLGFVRQSTLERAKQRYRHLCSEDCFSPFRMNWTVLEERDVFLTMIVWAFAWPLFLPLLFWKR